MTEVNIIGNDGMSEKGKLETEIIRLAARVRVLEITVMNIREYCSYEKIVRLEAVAEAAEQVLKKQAALIFADDETHLNHYFKDLNSALRSLRAGEGKTK